MVRNTSQREAIQEVFIRLQRPLTIDEIVTYGRESVASLNQATVYRNLKVLLKNQWLQQISHPSLGTLYELTNKEHHHHFYCHCCNHLYCLSGCLLSEQNSIAPDGFVVEGHELFLSGICPSCRKTTTKQKNSPEI